MRNHFSFEIPFMKYRKVLLTLSAVMTVLAIVGLLVRGLTFGIEFQGGTEIDFNGTGDISIEQMREALTNAGEADPTIQTTTASDGENGFIVRSDTTDPNTANDHAKQAAEALELSEANYNVTTIGPDWGADVTRSSLMAFGLAILLIIGYVSIRYEFKMSITAVIALIHDMVIILGIYAWTQIPVTPNVVAALLSTMGFSLYDTVVEFDRTNDNAKTLRDGIHRTYIQICNFSVNEVVVRSINTTITTLVPELAMYFFGGATLKDFAFAMILGELLGTYSSYAVATPLLAMWKTREPRWAKLEAKYGDGATAVTPVADA
ncbi:MAG: protein translocase subunit SecF [Atopobiaceae bacterium]|nr:protein translocase subunit SecF [Atopobiaceae bacterium]